MIEKIPIVFMVYDILEHEGIDLREKPMRERRAILEDMYSRLF